MAKVLALCAFLLVSLVPCTLAQECTGVQIGEMPTLFHEVSGVLYVESASTFCISLFNYDGLGPDAFLYFYYPGDEIDDTGGGVYVPLTSEQVQFELNRRYTNETLRFMLPAKYRACDFEGFGIWCRYANQLFTNITWDNAAIFSPTDAAGRITCEASPGRGYVGELPTLAHSVGGDLFIRDNKTFVIRDFTYDGQGPDAFVYWYGIGETADPNGGGFIIPLAPPVGITNEEGRFASTRYDGSSDLVIPIPADSDVYACDVGTFSIWCRQASQLFTSIAVDGELFTNNPLESAYQPDRILCNRPSTRPGVLIGELPTTNPRLISGTFYVQDDNTFFIQLFSYDASREETFLYYYPVGSERPDNTGTGGMRIRDNAFAVGRSESYFNQDFTVDLAGDLKTCDVGYFAIYDESVDELVTVIAIPQNIFSMEAEEGKIVCIPAAAMTTTEGAIPLCSTLSMLAVLAAALLALTLA